MSEPGVRRGRHCKPGADEARRIGRGSGEPGGISRLGASRLHHGTDHFHQWRNDLNSPARPPAALHARPPWSRAPAQNSDFSGDIVSKCSRGLRRRVLTKSFSTRIAASTTCLWSGARLVEPEQFNTWPLVRSLLSDYGRRLEVAPGLRPRLPIEGTQFVDISAPALTKLRERGAQVVLSQISSLPFADGAFDLVCALDIIEHVDDDNAALRELSRVTKPRRDSRDLDAIAPLALDRVRRFRRPQAALRAVSA